jgi:hypothetical protein
VDAPVTGNRLAPDSLVMRRSPKSNTDARRTPNVPEHRLRAVTGGHSRSAD